MTPFRINRRALFETRRIFPLKRILPFAILVFCVPFAGCGGGGSNTANAPGGTPAYVNGASTSDSSGTATSVTFHYSPKAGNTVVIAVALATAASSPGAVTAADNGASGGSQYLEGQPFNGAGGNTVVSLIYTTPGGVQSGVSTITVTLRQASKVVAVLGEYSGVAAFGLGSDYFDANGPTNKPYQTATVADNHDILVMAVNSIGNAAISANAGNLRNSSVTSGGSAASDVGGALVDIAATSSRDSVTLAVNTSASQDWLTSVLELKGAAPASAGGRLVQATTAFYQANDSNGAVWGVFQKPTTPGNLIVVAVIFTGNGVVPTIKDYLNTWSQAGSTLVMGQSNLGMWYALNSVSTSYVISYFAFPNTPGRAEIYEAEYSVPSGATFDASAMASGTSTALDSGAATTTGSMDLLVAVGSDTDLANSVSPGSGFARRIQDTSYGSDLFEDQVVTSAGSYDGRATDSAAGTWGIAVAAFNLVP